MHVFQHVVNVQTVSPRRFFDPVLLDAVDVVE